MTEFDRGSFGERMVMVCQICGSNHHDGQKEVMVQDEQTGRYRKAMCALCCCIDCVQLADDPIRKQIRPLMMGQTIQSTYNLNVEERKPGQEATRRNIVHKGPGPLDIRKVLNQMQGALGLQAPQAPPQHRIPQAVACGCGKNASSRCISCDVPLCVKCLKVHECES